MTKARELSDYTGLQGDLALKSPIASPSFTGNVGVGVTPEAAWHTDRTAIEMGAGSSFFAHDNVSRTYVGANEYHGSGGSSYYKNTAAASEYEQFSDGSHRFKVAPSGTADAAISWTTAMTIDNAGIVTKPLQPAFLATKTTTSSNMAIDVNNIISYNAERFDIGSNFASSIFTAPVTGKYHLTANVRLDQVDTAATFYQLKISTSNVTYSQIHSMLYTADPSYWSICFSIFADMDINDTARVYVKQTDGTAQTDIDGNPNYNNFSGYLVC